MQRDLEDKRAALAYNLTGVFLSENKRFRPFRMISERWMQRAIKLWSKAYADCERMEVRRDLSARLYEQRKEEGYSSIILIWIAHGFIVALVGVLVRWWLEDKQNHQALLEQLSDVSLRSASGSCGCQGRCNKRL